MLRWTVTREDGGKERAGQAVVAVGHQVYSFKDSRSYSTDPIDVKVFNTLSLRWRTLSPLTTGGGRRRRRRGGHMRYSHTAVLIDHVVYIWGGVTTWREDLSRKYCGVLYAFNVDTHRWLMYLNCMTTEGTATLIPKVSGAAPDSRFLHSACVLGKVMYVHGGSTQWTGDTNDLHKLDTTSMVWSVLNARGTPPPALTAHTATIIGTKMYVFGGEAPKGGEAILRVFDTETDHWLSTPSAQLPLDKRWDHSAFTYNGELYILGGWNQEQTFNDLWKFNPETFSWKKVEIKGKRPPFCGQYRMCCCMVGDRIVIFGGYGIDDDRFTPVLLNDLNILDLSPGLMMLCKLAVIRYGVEQSGLPHNIRWELAAMTTNSNT